MVAAIIILSVLLIAVILYFITYRRQVRRLSRQVMFLNEHQSEMRLDVDLRSDELVEMAEQINLLNERCKCVRLECLNEDTALRQTITNISHDIRTPLTSMDGYFQLLTEPGLDDGKRAYYISVIKGRIRNLNDMLDELFTYAKLQDHNFEMECTETDITGLTADVLMGFYGDIGKTDSEPVIEIGDGPVLINGNREALCRLEQNIIKNALLHGKKLQISLKKSGDGEHVIFVCSNEVDNQAADIDVNRVFERFYKADSSRNVKGSGLGMSIARELTLRHGGEITADFDREKRVFSVKVVLPLK